MGHVLTRQALKSFRGCEPVLQKHCKPPHSSRVETGHVTPSLHTLVGLSAALGVKPALLLAGLGVGDDAQLVSAGQGLEVVRRGTRRGHTYHLRPYPEVIISRRVC
jgi:hypothetical protein